MAEMIDIYTEDKQKVGTMSKREYYSQKGDDVPWINCCTCFVIDSKNKKILFEKRGKRFLDPGRLDLCSGHVRSGEEPMIGMIRELKEELSIDESVSSSIKHVGNMKVDYTQLQDETDRKRLKCFVSIYALKVYDISKIQIDNKEAISLGWLDFNDAKGFIENSMTRMPYNENLKSQYDTIFEKLDEYINNKKKRVEKEK
jgi:8-oxo-dGTP pyrophosphatase MutT (NUDIX family)